MARIDNSSKILLGYDYSKRLRILHRGKGKKGPVGYSEHEDRAGWEKYVDDMIRREAKLDTEEREKVLIYLTSLNPVKK